MWIRTGQARRQHPRTYLVSKAVEVQGWLRVRVTILPSCALKHMGTQHIHVVAKYCGHRERTLDTREADYSGYY